MKTFKTELKTNPKAKLEMAVPKNANVNIAPKFLKKCL